MPPDHESTRVTVRPRAGGVPADLGAPVLPGSKSHAQRALILAGLGAGSTTIENVPDSGDVQVMGAALEALGARVERSGATWQVHAAAALREAHIDCGDNGTALRMLAMVVGLLGGRAWFDGSARLRQRPFGETRDALAALGVHVGSEWPLQVDGSHATPRPGRVVQLQARATSQAVSGALLGLACCKARGLDPPGSVFVGDPIDAAALYWNLTIAVVLAFGTHTHGSTVAAPRSGLQLRIGEFDRVYPVGRYQVPPDASAATFVTALAAMHGRELPDWPADDGHPDWLTSAEVATMVVTPAGEECSASLLSLLPDTFPALCAIAAARPGRTVLRGAPALRHKESDRVAAMAAGLGALGVACEEHADGLVVHGCDLRVLHAPDPIALPAPRDHRIVMALSLLGTVVPAGVSVANPGAVGKSWPGFFAWLGRVADVR